jgi:pilus assembly protein Flp/PilA
MQILVRFFRDESGVTAIEYGLIAGLISVACIGAINTIGNTLLGFYAAINAALAAAV